MSELSSTRKKSYLKTTRQSQANSKKCKEDVRGSLMKFLSDCDTEDLLMNAVASPRKRIGCPLSMSEHTSSTAMKLQQNGKQESSNNSSKITIKAHTDATRRLSPGIGSSEHGTSTSSPGGLRKAQSARLMLESTGTNNKGSDGKKKTNKKSKATQMKKNNGNPDSDSYDDDSSVSISPPSSPITSPSFRRSSRSRKEGTSLFSESRSRNSPGRYNSKKKSISKRPAPPRRHNSEQGPSASSMRSPGGRKSRTTSRDNPRRSRSETRMAATGALDRKLSKENSTRSRSSSSRRRFSHSSDDNDNMSVGSTRSSMSRRSAASAPGLDAGPLNAFLNHAADRNNNNMSYSTTRHNNHGGESDKQHEEFMKRRKSRQDEILGEAMQGRWNLSNNKSPQKDKARRRNSTSSYGDSGNETDTNNNRDDNDDMDDDDQPMMVDDKGRKNPLRQLRRGLNKTAKTTRSAAKGSVNVVKNPKRAAKNIGGFAKDVGKETMKLALDPTLAAQTVGKVGAKGIGKTISVTAGVAEVSVGLTKSVAKTGLKTTTKMAGTVVDGAGKLLGLADKDGEDDDNYKDYHARDLNSRRRTNLSLLDRLSGKDEEDNNKNPDNELHSNGEQDAKSTNNTAKEHDLQKARVSKATSSLLMPIASGKGNSYDF